MCQALTEQVKTKFQRVNITFQNVKSKTNGNIRICLSSLMNCHECEISIIKVDSNMALLLLFEI